jgi:hypothetical protein
MGIEKLISNIVNEAVKKSDLAAFLMNKWNSESPKFNSLDPETKSNHTFGIIEAYKNIKSKIRLSNAAVTNFLKRHDGDHGSNLITIEQLNKITEIPFRELMELLSTVGDFKPMVSDDSSKVLGDDESKLIRTFGTSGNNPTEGKIETSKQMWYSPKNAVINEDGFRVYHIKDQTQAIRMGYYYQTFHLKQYRDLKLEVRPPWNVTFRKDFQERSSSGSSIVSHGFNKWSSFRTAHEASIYFVIDESINPFEDILNNGKYFMSVIEVHNDGGYQLRSMLNDGSVILNWKKLVSLYPKLDGHEESLKYYNFSPDELVEPTEIDTSFNEYPESKNYIGRQLPETQIAWFKDGNDITKASTWKYLTTPVRLAYIDTITSDNIFEKISNEDLMNEMLKGVVGKNGKRFETVLNDKMISIGKKNISFLTHHYYQSKYDVEFIGKRTPTRVVYSTISKDPSIDGLMGVFDTKTGKWFIGPTGIRYDARYKLTQNFRKKDVNGKTYLIFEFTSVIPFVKDDGIEDKSTVGVKFYVVNDEPFVSDKTHHGYIIGESSYRDFIVDFIESKTPETFKGPKTSLAQ